MSNVSEIFQPARSLEEAFPRLNGGSRSDAQTKRGRGGAGNRRCCRSQESHRGAEQQARHQRYWIRQQHRQRRANSLSATIQRSKREEWLRFLSSGHTAIAYLSTAFDASCFVVNCSPMSGFDNTRGSHEKHTSCSQELQQEHRASSRVSPITKHSHA